MQKKVAGKTLTEIVNTLETKNEGFAVRCFSREKALLKAYRAATKKRQFLGEIRKGLVNLQ